MRVRLCRVVGLISLIVGSWARLDRSRRLRITCRRFDLSLGRDLQRALGLQDYGQVLEPRVVQQDVEREVDIGIVDLMEAARRALERAA
ncbi:MAG: hypothetical protein P8Y07_09965, partial [Gemmatimonadales bacterium]